MVWKVLHVGAIETALQKNYCRGVLSAMIGGQFSAVVVEKGMAAVASLCEQRDDHAEGRRAMFGMTLSAIPLLLEVMRKHRRSEEIVRVSFLAVWYLTRNDDIKRIIGESGGIPLLVEMLEEHGKRNVAVANFGLNILHNLTTNIKNQRMIVMEGGIAIIFDIMKAHSASNTGVVEKGCGVLFNLSCNEENHIVAAGGIPVILDFMKLFGPSNAGVAEIGCAVIYNLANDTDNKRKILDAYGVHIVEHMKATWSSNEDVQKEANDALGRLQVCVNQLV